MAKKIVDLTMTIHKDMIVYPDAWYQTPVFIDKISWEKGDAGLSRVVMMSEHTGTHIDAPAHTWKGGKTIEQFPIEKLVGDGVIWNVPKGKLEEITVEDLEKAKPQMRENDIVFVNTGYGIGSKEENLARPGFGPDAADWLVKKKAKIVGQDTISTGRAEPKIKGITQGHMVHDQFLSKEILLVEVLANLDKVAGKRAWISISPLPFKGGSASPARVYAIIDQ